MAAAARERRGWPLASVLALALPLIALLAARSPAWSAAAPDAPVLSDTEHASKLRVTASPGDPKLENGELTAVVRRRDGWLTELWPKRLRLPTEPQLGTTTDIDALWQLFPCVRIGKETHPIVASSVTRSPGAIVTEGSVRVQGAEFHARTEFRLEPAAAKIVLSTTFSVKGRPAQNVGFGDAVRWGNVQYVVAGQPRALSEFHGTAAWIGRHGAAGDLLLRTRPEAPISLNFEEKDPGFAGPIYAVYWSGAPQAPLTVTRELSFEPLPRRAPSLSHTPPGMLELSIEDERGRPLAAKARVERVGHGAPPFDRDGDVSGADRFLWTGSGEVQRELEPGNYRLLLSAGIERELSRHTVVVKSGRTQRVEARLPRALRTPGWIGADLHLHQAPSVDADVSLPDRVISIAAEGVEFAVATDHYAVTDLAPTVRWLTERGVLRVPLQTMAGIEVSTVGRRFGHFNLFPMLPGDGLLAEDTTPDELFPRARSKSPNGVWQVNHPRWEPNTGYFTHYDLDPLSGAPRRAGYNPDFDTVEVYNGLDAFDLPRVERVLLEWLRLLGRGHRYAATGSSDSHKLAFLDPGLPRTLIHYGTADSDDRDVLAAPHDVVDAIKAGRSIITSGPVIDASIDGRGPGETVSATGGKVQLKLGVRAASWVDVREVTVLEGGKGRVVFQRRLPPSTRVERFNATVPLSVSAPTFLVVVVRGERPLPTAAQVVRPFAFTNPIWISP